MDDQPPATEPGRSEIPGMPELPAPAAETGPPPAPAAETGPPPSAPAAALPARKSRTWKERLAWFLASPFSRLVLLIVLFGLVEAFVVRPLETRGPFGTFFLQEVLQAVISLVLLVSVGLLIERRTLAAIGLPWRGAARDTLAGFGLGLFLIASVIAGMSAAGWYRIESVSDHPLGVFAGLGFFYVAAAFEEILFRGILFRIVEEGMGSWFALAVSSAFFGLAHLGNPNATGSSALAIVLEAGILLGACYMIRRSLWYVTAIHCAWNFTQGTIFGASVSGSNVGAEHVLFRSVTDGPPAWTGGGFGPEGGLVAVIICTAAGVIALGVAIHHRQVITPAWMRRIARRFR
jgi:membrane protease YdiL (CAAX protease family)